jgi:SpoVK/Ycf46/Vps4 family AAA+-type ATPase
LDPALLRPGRLSHIIEVKPPQTQEERLAVLKIHTAKVSHENRTGDDPRSAPLTQRSHKHTQMPLRVPASPSNDTDPVDLGGLAVGLAGYSGADIEGLCR